MLQRCYVGISIHNDKPWNIIANVFAFFMISHAECCEHWFQGKPALSEYDTRVFMLICAGVIFAVNEVRLKNSLKKSFMCFLMLKTYLYQLKVGHLVVENTAVVREKKHVLIFSMIFNS